MNYEFFIAKRLIQKSNSKDSISSLTVNIASFSVALSVVVMLVSIGIGIGIQGKIREKVSGVFGHIQIKAYENEKSYITKPINKKQKFYPNITKLGIEGINHIQAYANRAGVIKNKEGFEGVILKGVDENYQWKYLQEYLIKGKIPTYDAKKYNDSILISNLVANGLKLNLGDKFNMYFFRKSKPPKIRTFTIIGIFDTSFVEFDKNFVIGDIKHIQKLNKWGKDKVGGFEIYIDYFKKLRPIAGELYRNLNYDLDVTDIKDSQSFLMNWIELFDLNILIIILIMVLVSGVNMITVLIILVLERTQMIGVLKAMGSYNKSIRKIFLYGALKIMIRGLLWGNIVGILLLCVQKYFGLITLEPETYYVSVLPVDINILHIFLVNFITVILCLMMMLIPSYIVSKIKPSNAIKFD